MIEIPSAAVIAGLLVERLDFLSLGTNDLVQYLLAADREDSSMSAYYRHSHPAVLKLIAMVAVAAREHEKELSICGEMAGDPRFTELLLGLGLRNFSVSPGRILEIKSVIRRTCTAQAQALAAEALGLAAPDQIEELLRARYPAQA